MAGSNSIQVVGSTGWSVGDTIGISPSFRIHTEYEKVTITKISADGLTVTFTPALLYNHYGDSSQFNTDHGRIDLRAKVAHLNRNITIVFILALRHA